MKYKHIHKNIYKSHKRHFAFCFLRFWIELWYDFILEFLLWGYCWGSMQIIFDSLQCGCYWPKAHPETSTNPGSSDEWLKTGLNETENGSISAAWKLQMFFMCVCVYSKVYTIYIHVCVQCWCVCYFPCPWGKLGPFWGALRTAREKPHTFSQAIQSVCLLNTAPNGHLWVCIRCPNK